MDLSYQKMINPFEISRNEGLKAHSIRRRDKARKHVIKYMRVQKCTQKRR